MLGQVDDLLGCLVALSFAGLDAEVHKANQSDVGKRNGGAMLSMQVSRVSKGPSVSSSPHIRLFASVLLTGPCLLLASAPGCANFPHPSLHHVVAMLGLQPNERALLMMLVARLHQIDADVFVGHNFAAFDLDVLLHRMQHHKVTRLQAEHSLANGSSWTVDH